MQRRRVGMTSVLVAGVAASVLMVPGTPAAAGPAVPGTYQAVPQTRVLDTRSGIGGVPRTKVPGHGTVTFAAAAAAALPSQVSTAVLDLTVIDPHRVGGLSAYPGGAPFDGTVSMVFGHAGSPAQQQLTVRLGTGGTVTLRNDSAGALDLVADAVGYYNSGAPTVPGTFAPASGRLLDTRSGIGAARVAVGPGGTITLPVTGHRGVPAGASAVVANVAVLDPTRTGLLRITDHDGSASTVNLRFEGGASMLTMRALKLGSDGTLTLHNTGTGSLQLVLDLAGYFVGGTVTVPGGYVPNGDTALLRGVAFQLPAHGRSSLATGIATQGLPSNRLAAVNLLIVPTAPGNGALIGMFGSDVRWNGSPTICSSPAAQPSEQTTTLGAAQSVTLANFGSAGYFKAFATGYYLA